MAVMPMEACPLVQSDLIKKLIVSTTTAKLKYWFESDPRSWGPDDLLIAEMTLAL